MTDPAWEPTGYYAERSNLARFVEEYGYGEYDDLIPGTEEELADLWGAFAEDTGIVWREPYDEVVDTSGGAAFADWFPGGGSTPSRRPSTSGPSGRPRPRCTSGRTRKVGRRA